MRFGIACRDIVPPFRTRMYGYGARIDLYEDVNDPLTFTAIVLEEGNRRALLGAADLGTFPRLDELSGFLDQLGEIVGCPRDHIMLNCSHSHGAATVSDERYREWLYEKVREAAQEASENANEGTLWYGEGKTSLPLNRRPERDGQVVNAPNPEGTVDDRMRLLVFRKPTGEIAALGMSVACHPVATGAQHLLTAEYPGAWRNAFSRAFGPDVTPFFLQGAGGDIRPRHVAEGDHWRAMKHAELPGMGQELLREMLKILLEADFKQIDNLTLTGKINRVEAPCQRLYTTREELESLRERDGRFGSYAEKCLQHLNAGEEVPAHAEFHVQTLWLNREFALIGLDAEPLHDLGRAIEDSVSPRQALFLGYTNGCIGYAMDGKETERGGGTEIGTYLFRGWSGPPEPGLEKVLADAVVNESG